jgi:hypothetical protein
VESRTRRCRSSAGSGSAAQRPSAERAEGACAIIVIRFLFLGLVLAVMRNLR